MRWLIYGDCFSKLFSDCRDKPGKWASRILFLLGPWLSFWVVEILNGNDVFDDLEAWQVLMNLVWYYIGFVVLRLVLGHRKWASSAGALLAFTLGLVNHYVLRFRGRILFPADIAGWHTAANVAEGFDYSMDLEMRCALILLISYLFLVLVCTSQKRRDRLPKPAAAALIVLVVGYSVAFFQTNMLPALGIYTQQWVTQGNGFLLNFTVALRYSSVEKPDRYSDKAVLELMDEYPGQQGDVNAVKPTNIIVIMNESFSDMTMFDTLEVSEDPTPFLHSMKENTIKGWLYSPVTGGGTASVEFEYLTGLATLFQPPHTVAYQLYMEENMPSLAALAGGEGYDTTAFHPYKSSGWNRPIAYQCLSFAHQMYQEDVSNPAYIRNYISDQSDYESVMETTDRDNASGQGSFVFNVTIQNHSGYAQGWRNLDRFVDLPPELSATDNTAQQYFDLVRASDEALESLLTHYQQSDEPTMIIFFGDHQPPLKNAFYEKLYGKALSKRTTAEVLQQYAVPFFIWTNYDIEEQSDVILSPNYLGVLTAKTAGLPLTGFMQFLNEMYQQIPVITPVGFITRDGECLDEEQLDEEQLEWLHNYEILNYCGMVDLFDEARPMFCTG